MKLNKNSCSMSSRERRDVADKIEQQKKHTHTMYFRETVNHLPVQCNIKHPHG